MEQVVTDYLSYLDIPISERYCVKCILSHPEYPSLLSVADTLQRLGINHQVGQLEKTNADDLLFPCIIHLDRGGGQLLFLKDQDDLKKHNPDLEDWDGIVLKVNATDTITDEEHNEQYSREKKRRKLSSVLVVALLGLMIFPLLQATSWLYLLLFATSVGGAVVGYLLLAKDLGITYKPVERFCNAGKRINCDRILNAEDAKLFGFLSFTDAAAGYFFFQLLMVGLFIPLFEGTASFLLVLAAASVLALPVIGYSLYYQSVKAKTWCWLCVIIDAILGLQAGLFALMYAEQMFALTSVQLVPVLISVFLFAVVTSSILLLKNRLETADKPRKEAIAANRVKHDPGIFTQLLLEEEKIDATLFSPEIILGEREAPVRILMVANLHCHPCRKAFDTIRQLLASYPEKACFYLRFTKGMDNTIGELSVSTYLIRYWHRFIYGSSKETERTKRLLTDWYSQMDPEFFAKQYPLTDGMTKVSENNSEKPETRHYQWVEQNEIKRTPTFFVNGYKMPQHYRIKDLKAMVPGLADFWKKNSPTGGKIVKEFA